MSAIKIEATIQVDGELFVTGLPFRKGDRVQAAVSVLPVGQQEGKTTSELSSQEKKRAEALQRFLARASASKFRSVGPYPSRDELHERR